MNLSNTLPYTVPLRVLDADLKLAPVSSVDELFANQQALEVEVGCGKGKFLLARAAQIPERNFLGVDRVAKWMKLGAKKALKRELSNLRFLKGEMGLVMDELLAPGSVSVFHIYFPDPWPKRRHRKRRLVGPDFLRQLHRCLQPGGVVEIATDFEDYFEQMKETVSAVPLQWAQVRHRHNSRFLDIGVMTNYETKFISAGKTIYYLELMK